MAIPLGASLSDPNFVFLQILHTVSIFFIVLGVVRVVLGVLSLAFFDSSAYFLPLTTSLGFCFHVPLRSLFAVKVSEVSDGSDVRFFLMHLLAAFGLSAPLALTIQRRKFALDFAFTVYVIYFFFCCLVERRLTGGGFAWWLSVLTGFCVLYGVTTVLCRRRELQDIFFPLSTSVSTTSVGINGGNVSHNDNNNNNSDNVMMTTMSIAVDAHEVDVDGRLLSNGCVSPRTASEVVPMGPGRANKRRWE